MIPNIFIYAYDANSVYHKKTVAFLSDPAFEFYTTTKNISEFFAVLSKQKEPFAKVFRFYQSILANAKLLFPDSNSLSVFEVLLQKYQPQGNRVFDFEIVSIALASQISEVATVNTKDFSVISEIGVRPI